VHMMPTLPGVYTVRLTVTGAAGTAVDYMNVTVPNVAPEINLPEVITVASTEVVADNNNPMLWMSNFTIDADLFDANGEPVTIQWVPGNNAGNVSIKSSTATSQSLRLQVGGAEMTGGVYAFTAHAYDNGAQLGQSPTSKTVTIRVVSATVVPPVAVALNDSVVDLAAATTNGVRLNGSNSHDPNSANAVTFQWSLSADSPAGVFDNDMAANPLFTPSAVGVYTINLTVTDSEMLTDSDSITIIVVEGNDGNPMTKDNTLPITVVETTHVDGEPMGMENESINVGEAVTMDASGTRDTDGDTLTYLWKQLAGPMVSLADPTLATQSFTPTQAGVYVFWVRATDGDGRGVPALETINVANAGNATINAVAALAAADAGTPADRRVPIYDGGNGIGVDGDENNVMINLTAAASSSDAGGLTYFWTQVQGPTVGLRGIQSAAASFWPVDANGDVLVDTYAFQVTVKDATGAVDTDTIFIAVQTYDPVNNPGGESVPTAVTGDEAGTTTLKGTRGAQVTLTGSNSFDDDGDNLTYYWTQISGPTVVLDLTDPANPTFVAPAAAVYRFVLRVQDGAGITSLEENGANLSAPELVVVEVGNPRSSGNDGCSLNAVNGGIGGLGLILAVLAGMVVVRRRRREEAAA
ncbi:MAG: hypothetical protein KDB07_08665, partial [Planctomycetes bacterium]|nr:hypothetical protein [Planctomycetota bacterium]